MIIIIIIIIIYLFLLFWLLLVLVLFLQKGSSRGVLRFSDSWGLRFLWKSVKRQEWSTLFQKRQNHNNLKNPSPRKPNNLEFSEKQKLEFSKKKKKCRPYGWAVQAWEHRACILCFLENSRFFTLFKKNQQKPRFFLFWPYGRAVQAWGHRDCNCVFVFWKTRGFFWILLRILVCNRMLLTL